MGRARHVFLAVFLWGAAALVSADDTNTLVVREPPAKSRRSLREIPLSDLKELRLPSTNNVPLKVLMACTQPTRAQVQGMLAIVKAINEQEHLGKDERIRVHLVVDGANTRSTYTVEQGLPAEVKVPSTLRELTLTQADFETFVEVSRARAFGMPDAWLQDWGKVLMAHLSGTEAEQLVVLDVNRTPASDVGLPGVLSKQWSGLYARLLPAGVRGTAGDYGGNMEVTPDDCLLLGSTASGALRRLFSEGGYGDRTTILDVDWLKVGHVDEIVGVVPTASNPRGYAILKADPNLGLALHPDGAPAEENRRVAGIIDESVANLIKTIQKSSGDPSDVAVLSLPVLFRRDGDKFVASFPNVVNLVSLRNHAVVPDPMEPAFRERTAATLLKLGITPHFLADTPYHDQGGELHCGTYVFRHPGRYLVKNRLLVRRQLFRAEEKK